MDIKYPVPSLLFWERTGIGTESTPPVPPTHGTSTHALRSTITIGQIEPIRERTGAVPPVLRVSSYLKVEVPPPRNGAMSLSLCTSTYF